MVTFLIIFTFVLLFTFIGGLMAVQKDLIDAVDRLNVSVTALEMKADTTEGFVSQEVLDSTVASLNDFAARVDAETAKK